MPTLFPPVYPRFCGSRMISAPAAARAMGLGAEPWSTSSDQFDKYVRADIDKWAKVIQTAGIKVQ